MRTWTSQYVYVIVVYIACPPEAITLPHSQRGLEGEKHHDILFISIVSVNPVTHTCGQPVGIVGVQVVQRGVVYPP